MSRDSERLLEVAELLVAQCPDELGSEVFVTGSVGAGLADEHSDIELVFLGATVPEPERITEWLEGIEGTEAVLAGPEASGVWAWCRFGGVEIDPFWGALEEAVDEVDAISGGTVLEHPRLAFAHVLLHSVPLRTSGELAELASRCATYPEGLAQRLIEESLMAWQLPATRLGSVVRGDVLESRAWLQHDAEKVLRIVFALNERWEPPRWKWLRTYAGSLPLSPPRLADRIEAALNSDELAGSSRALAELALEALDLLPADVDHERARAGLVVRLAALERRGVAAEVRG